MRLWTVHPAYLDAIGLVALWREGLLAQKVLQGGTRGYRHHPQLIRFQGLADPEAAIATYLCAVSEEALRRGYSFDVAKIGPKRYLHEIEETEGQLLYEWRHLKRKLRQRDQVRYKSCRHEKMPSTHPLFRIVPGRVQRWERVK